jgi:hypothetical protein
MWQNKKGHPSCKACFYYYVTWDPAAPYGCKAFGFKSAACPALIAHQNSGIRCQMFREKPKQKVKNQ